MPQHGGDLARFYTVTEPRRHDKGHTVYKVTARIVSRKNPENVEEIVVWKRYNDIKKLHKELCMIHRNLFRRSEEFPPFAKATVFVNCQAMSSLACTGRFEDSVIEERRQCAEDLLQFSANIPSLYNSRQLQEFFEGGDKHEGSDIIGPADSPTDSFSDSLHQGPEDRLQGKGPLSSHAREDGGDRDEETESVDTLPDLPDILLTSPAPGAASGTGSGCSGLDVCGPAATGGGVSEAAADILLPSLPSTAGEMEPPASPFSSPLSPDGVPGDDEADDWPDGAGAGRPAMGRQDSLFSLSTAGRGKDDYLVVASQQIHLALAQEVLGNYQGAFDAYKMGVDLLLQGVQGDTNTVRRDMVKRKTAQYLLHAEEIYTGHLQAQPETGAMAQADRGLSFGPPNLCASPLEDLKKFRVLGVIGKVLLVLDPKNGETFVMKGLRKSSQMSQIQKTVVVRSVPFLVHLIRYFSTEDSIFLLLRYATGGQLWSNVSGFLNRSPEESVEYAREAEADAADSSRDSDEQRAGVAALLVPQVATSSPASSSEPPQAPLADITEISKGSSYDDGSTSEDGDEEEDEELDDSEVKGDDRSLSTDSGEREYSNSYLSLFQEYQQEAEQRVTEEVAQPVNAFSATDGADSNSQCQEMSGQSMSHLSSDSLCSPATLQEHVFFPAEGIPDVFAEPPRSGDHLRDSKSSPMELFRIDSGDSGGDFPFVDRVDSSERMSAAQAADGRDTSDTIEDVVAQNERMMKIMHDELDVCVDAGVSDDKSDSASEVIPIISFREAAEEDTFSHGSGRSDVGTFYARPRPGSAASGAQEVVGTPDLFATDSTLLCATGGVEQSEQEDRHSGMIAVCGESDDHATNEIEYKVDSNGVVSAADVVLGAAVDATTEASRTNDEVRIEADSDLGAVVDSVREGDKKLEGNSHDHSTKTNVDNGNATFGDVYASQGLLESAATMATAAVALPWVDATRAEAEAVATAPTATCPESLPVSKVRRHAEEEEDDGDDDVNTSTVAATRARDVSQVFRELEEARSRATECRICLPEGCVRQWAAEMVVAVDGLHQHGLICRDLNPSNILLDDRGHILLTYFGQWSEVDQSCSSLAQEQFYCAPEVGGIAEETEACDWWSLGAIMFELLTGQALHVSHPTGITTHTTLHLPEHLSPEAASLLRQLLQFNAWERLGVEEIRAHPFFSAVQWGRLAGH
ncbi:ribosomal protein S6 kinase delta-1-like isoform X2 [Petromyzon marinus]|uniref:Ribosomal protein S6 kinase delta-1-like isoform X2 n=1 Tax=Petromyzon marinus TaxID=7757 RepID=A0AAJ7X368_PETMA|nr:ribosomal protein S6 kinase delta-1-like isoform X2 [Petromyzon marinus]